MKPSRQWSLGLWLSLVFSVGLSGCISDTLNQYALTDYGPGLADRLCHPFWDCQQGEWERVGKSEIDTIIDYAECEGDFDAYGEWFSTTVALGLEAGRCMESKGYVLMFPNPLRH